MTDWIDFFIYAAFMLVFWFVSPRLTSRLSVPYLADRNPEWVAKHPETIWKIGNSRWYVWLCGILGVVSLAALASLQLGLWPTSPATPEHPPARWMIQWGVTILSMLAGLLVMGGIGVVGYITVIRRIPVATRRQATLERRSIDDFIPRWMRYGTYTLIALNLAAWTAAGIMGAHSTPIFWTRFVILIALSAFFHFFTGVAVKRRPNVLDRILGQGNRAAEVRFNFTCQLLPPIVGAVRLYEEVNDTVLMDINRAMQLALILMVIYGLLRTSHLTPRLTKPDANGESAHDISPA